MKQQRKSQKKRVPSKRAPSKQQGDFRLPPGVSSTKESLPDGWAYVFRHQELGLLGRIVLQAFAGGNTHVSLELAGDPADPMTAKRAEIFKPLAAELTQRLEVQSGDIEVPLGVTPPSAPPPSSRR